MESIYYDPSAAGSYGGVQPLARYSKKPDTKTREWLKSQDAYTLHKPIRHRFLRRKTYAKGINDLFQAVLVDLQSLAKYNDNYRYILTCIDVV